MTPTLNHRLSEAEICRINGWSAGTRLVGDEGRGPEMIEITGVGRNSVLASRVDARGELGYEREWTLKHREWRKVEGK